MRAGSSRTRLAVIGWPIGHSRSPAIHTAALRAAGPQFAGWTYEALAVAPDELAEFLQAVRRPPWRGFNVTIPHKEAVYRAVEALDPVAARCGAVNTVVVTAEGRLEGYNTDVAGVLAALGELGWSLADRCAAGGALAAVLGAGGAAAAAVVAMAEAGVGEVAVVARRPEQAAVLVERTAVTGRVLALGTAPARRVLGEAAILVNATPVGMGTAPGTPAWDAATSAIGEWLPNRLAPGARALDLVYGARPTPFEAVAARRGAAAADGLAVLVHQAASAFSLWTGRRACISAMRCAATPETT